MKIFRLLDQLLRLRATVLQPASTYTYSTYYVRTDRECTQRKYSFRRFNFSSLVLSLSGFCKGIKTKRPYCLYELVKTWWTLWGHIRINPFWNLPRMSTGNFPRARQTLVWSYSTNSRLESLVSVNRKFPHSLVNFVGSLWVKFDLESPVNLYEFTGL